MNILSSITNFLTKSAAIPAPAYPTILPDTGSTTPNAHVKILQEMLYAQGFYQGKPDGYNGPLTQSAIRYFQQTHNGSNGNPLTVDGVVGSATWWALANPSGKAQTIKEPVNFAPSEVRSLTSNISRNKVLGMAFEQLGCREIPDGSNTGDGVTKFHKFCGMGPIYWCLASQVWIFYNALGKLPWSGGEKYVHVATFWNTRTAMERIPYHTGMKYTPRPADLFVMVHKDGSGHIGMIVGVHKDGRLLVAEGNSANRFRLVVRVPGKNDHVGYINCFGDRDALVTFTLGFPNDAGELTGLNVTR